MIIITVILTIMCSSISICSVEPEGVVLSHFGSVFPQATYHSTLCTLSWILELPEDGPLRIETCCSYV